MLDLIYYVISCLTFITLLLTLMAIISSVKINPEQKNDVDGAKLSFYVFSGLLFANVIILYVMHLGGSGIHFDYPIALLIFVVLEILFIGVVLSAMVKSIRKYFS